MSSSAKDTSKVADKKIVAKVDADAKAKPKSTLELLEEDDEFEEFDAATWEDAKATEKADGELWKDDWDDDGAGDDFTQQLRAHVDQLGSAGSGSAGGGK